MDCGDWRLIHMDWAIRAEKCIRWSFPSQFSLKSGYPRVFLEAESGISLLNKATEIKWKFIIIVVKNTLKQISVECQSAQTSLRKVYVKNFEVSPCLGHHPKITDQTSLLYMKIINPVFG
jgi:hypothetical protein